MNEDITLKEAKDIIDEYPDKDDFVNKHLQGYLVGGQYDDNSLDTSFYWQKCKDIVDAYNAMKIVEEFTIQSHMFDLWLWKCGMIEKNAFSRKNHDDLKRTEWSKEFENEFRKHIYLSNIDFVDSAFQEFTQFQKNRLIMAVYRYGKLNNETKPHYDYLEGIEKYFKKYLESGNAEYLVDAANYCLLEFVERSNKQQDTNRLHHVVGGNLCDTLSDISDNIEILMAVYRQTKLDWHLIQVATYMYIAYCRKIHPKHHFLGNDNTELHAKLKF